MGAKSRRKGAGGEREFAALAEERGFLDAKRTAPMQAGGYADEFGDVSGVPLLYLECKRYRRTPVNRFAREVLHERPGFVSVLAWRDDGQPWRVTLDAADFLTLHRELIDLRSQVARLLASLAAIGGGA
jgi:Holliday junction resolvase